MSRKISEENAPEIKHRLSLSDMRLNLLRIKMVPAAGLEPARDCSPRILSPLCLPFHHAGKSSKGKNLATKLIRLFKGLAYP
jgi:hypothetical protein